MLARKNGNENPIWSWNDSPIEQSFKNIKYESYPENAYFDDLPIEYEQRLFTKQPIDCLIKNNVERLKFGMIGRYLHNIIYKSNPQDTDFDDLPFDGVERFTARRQIYCINDDIIFRLNNGLSISI